MIHLVPGIADRLARLALALLAFATLASCSGAVGSPPVVVTPGPLSISPAAATLYSDLPTAFIITGGNGQYVITSSNQFVIPIVGVFTGNQLTIVPGPVAADTPIPLTVSDTGGSTPVTAALVVKPRTVSNVVTITPSSSQSAACGTAICSGGDAEVKVVLGINGVPLRGRVVRFDVVSGDIRIITSAAGLPETLSLSGTAATDDTQRTSVTIAPSSNAPLNAQPSTIQFQGTAPGTCASGISADVIVFGGRPPYQISQPGSFSVSPTMVVASGGRFNVGATGQCSSASQIAVVDSNGATVGVTATNLISPVQGTATTAFSVSPQTAKLDTCSDVFNVSLSGGSGSYIAASGNSSVKVIVNSNIGSISRASGPSAPASVTVSFSDGRTVIDVPVTLTGPATMNAQGPC